MIFIIMKGYENYTSWDHFKKNYKWVALFILALFTYSLVDSLVSDSGGWGYSFIYLGIGVVLVIANYISWKKTFGKKK